VPTDVSAALTWKNVGGSEPEHRETQPRVGTVREVGPIWGGGAALEFRASPGRADWLISPAIPADIQTATYPNLGEIGEAVGKFRELVFAVAANAYDAPRYAVGLVALHLNPSKEASYNELSGLLQNASLRLEGASDFSYQINRPRVSRALNGLKINRLSRWSSSAFFGLQVQLSVPLGGEVPGSVTGHARELVHATRVDIDINCPADRAEPIPSAARLPLLEELAQLALELPQTGDVP
jgi:hypothetical protein